MTSVISNIALGWELTKRGDLLALKLASNLGIYLSALSSMNLVRGKKTYGAKSVNAVNGLMRMKSLKSGFSKENRWLQNPVGGCTACEV